MSKKNQLLEVDETLFENKLKVTENESDEFASLFSHLEKPSKLVHPTPGICIKIRTDDGNKLFINLCQTDEIPAPEDITEERMRELLASEDDSGFRVPMSIGELKKETDRSGLSCKVVDVAIHSKFLAKVENQAAFRTFFVHIIVEGVRDKHGIKAEANDFIVLKNRKVMGSLQPHRIEKRDVQKSRKKPLIETISSDSATTPFYHEQVPEFVVLRRDKMLVAKFFLPGMKMENIQVSIGNNRLILEASSDTNGAGDSTPKFRLDRHLPEYINPKDSRALYDPFLHRLVLLLPLDLSQILKFQNMINKRLI